MGGAEVRVSHRHWRFLIADSGLWPWTIGAARVWRRFVLTPEWL
jgi:hypothetical protein